jgi:hypothetical protein
MERCQERDWKKAKHANGSKIRLEKFFHRITTSRVRGETSFSLKKGLMVK